MKVSIGLLTLLLLISVNSAAGQTTAEDFYARAVQRSLLGDSDGALADANQAIRLKPDYDSAYNQRAIIYDGKGDLDSALADYSKAIELRPKFATYYLNRAKIRERKNDVAGAKADYDKAVEVAPKSKYSYAYRSKLRVKIKDYNGAIADCNKALEIDPAYWAVLMPRGAAYRALGNIALAEADEKKYKDEMKKLMDELAKP